MEIEERAIGEDRKALLLAILELGKGKKKKKKEESAKRILTKSMIIGQYFQNVGQ